MPGGLIFSSLCGLVTGNGLPPITVPLWKAKTIVERRRFAPDRTIFNPGFVSSGCRGRCALREQFSGDLHGLLAR
jgi:hypothetical protein